jgi:hypothetical protein
LKGLCKYKEIRIQKREKNAKQTQGEPKVFLNPINVLHSIIITKIIICNHNNGEKKLPSHVDTSSHSHRSQANNIQRGGGGGGRGPKRIALML